MDPQQRLVLELAWEALERARIAPTCPWQPDRRRRRCHQRRLRRSADRSGLGSVPHTMTGVLRSLLANRVSYLLGLRGPSLTVDAAQARRWSPCSSRARVCASASRPSPSPAGSTYILPETTTGDRADSARCPPDGRCCTFDAARTVTYAVRAAASSSSSRCPGRWPTVTTDLLRHRWKRGQQRRRRRRSDRAEPAGPAGSPSSGYRQAGVDAGRRAVRRAARHRHPGRRPDRGGRAGRRWWAVPGRTTHRCSSAR